MKAKKKPQRRTVTRSGNYGDESGHIGNYYYGTGRKKVTKRKKDGTIVEKEKISKSKDRYRSSTKIRTVTKPNPDGSQGPKKTIDVKKKTKYYKHSPMGKVAGGKPVKTTMRRSFSENLDTGKKTDVVKTTKKVRGRKKTSRETRNEG